MKFWIAGNQTVLQPEQIICQQIIHKNKDESNTERENPVFDLFLTKFFYPSVELISDKVWFEEIAAYEKSIFSDE